MAPLDDRLARIEKKLDDVGQAIVSLARMEERMVTLFRRMDTYDKAQDSVEARLSDLERSVGTNGVSIRFAERVFWIVLAAGVTYAMSGGWAG